MSWFWNNRACTNTAAQNDRVIATSGISIHLGSTQNYICFDHKNQIADVPFSKTFLFDSWQLELSYN